MAYQEPLKVLREELLRRGLPGDYVEHVIAELADHAEDLARASVTPGAQAAARLGEPIELAEQICHEFQRRTFLGRHPLLTFVALPGISMLLAWLATMVAIGLSAELILLVTAQTEVGRWTAAVVVGILGFSMTYLVPLAVGWWSLRKAKQTTRRLSWIWATAGVLALASLLLRISIYHADDGLFVIDCPQITHCAFECLLCWASGESVPTDLFWRLSLHAPPIGYLVQVVVLIGATAIAIRQRRKRMTLQAMEAVGHAQH